MNRKYMAFFVFCILQKVFTRYPLFTIRFPSKICTKHVKVNIWNCYLTSNSTNRLGVYQAYFFPRLESIELLLIAFFLLGLIRSREFKIGLVNVFNPTFYVRTKPLCRKAQYSKRLFLPLLTYQGKIP